MRDAVRVPRGRAGFWRDHTVRPRDDRALHPRRVPPPRAQRALRAYPRGSPGLCSRWRDVCAGRSRPRVWRRGALYVYLAGGGEFRRVARDPMADVGRAYLRSLPPPWMHVSAKGRTSSPPCTPSRPTPPPHARMTSRIRTCVAQVLGVAASIPSPTTCTACQQSRWQAPALRRSRSGHVACAMCAQA